MAAMKKKKNDRVAAADLEEYKKKRFEILCGLVIAFFAAVLAVIDLGAGKFGDDEIIAHNEKNNSYTWYQSKSMKQNLAEGQRDLLTSLVESGAIQKEKAAGVRAMTDKLGKDIERYGKEKKEILLGSSAVGKQNWVQDVDGTMGAIALVLQIDRFKWIFFYTMVGLGAIGTIVAVKAFLTAFGAPPVG